MPLELRRQRNGSLRKNWYARYEINGRRFTCNLNLRVAGTPPASLSLRDEGDLAFERSRASAQEKLNQLVDDAQSQQGSARLVEKLYEIKTGEKIQGIPLKRLPEEWAKLPRRNKPAQRYIQCGKAMLRRLSEFVRSQNSSATEIIHVTRQAARSFLEVEEGRGIGAKTWNDTLKLLRGAFKHLLPSGAVNPWQGIPTKNHETVFRKPYSPEELRAIVDAAKHDDFVRPIVIAAMCTAMRRGDCCLLKWSDVDLAKGFITVKTSKTGARVDIPIFGMLREELLRQRKAGDGEPRDGFVFPKQAAMYQENPDGITWRVKKALADALSSGTRSAEAALPEVSEAEARCRGESHLVGLAEGAKRERMTTVFKAYMDGKSLKAVVKETGMSQGSVSNYLKAIEKAIRCRVVRARPANIEHAGVSAERREVLQKERAGGMRRASVRDFHSFRVTWVTVALSAGVPLELVRKVTGHKTAEVVLQHYFQPGREAFREALQKAMPKLLTDASRSPRDEMREVLEHMSPRTLKRDKAKLLKLLANL